MSPRHTRNISSAQQESSSKRPRTYQEVYEIDDEENDANFVEEEPDDSSGLDEDEEEDVTGLVLGQFSTDFQQIRVQNDSRRWVQFQESYQKKWHNWWNHTEWAILNSDVKITWSKRKRTSSVWKHFDGIALVETGLPALLCAQCNGKATHSDIKKTGTTHLKSHLKSQGCVSIARRAGHGDIRSMLDYKGKQSERFTSQSNQLFDDDDYKEQWMVVLASLNLSFRSLDHPQLLKLVQMIHKAPRDRWIPYIPTPRNAPILIEARIQQDLLRILKRKASATKISVAVDCWTSPNKIGFMAVTGYFIDRSWSIQRVVLGFEPVHGSHTGANLATTLEGVLTSAQITPDQLLTITGDNAGNNKTLVEKIATAVQIYQRENIVNQGESASVVHVPCLAHVIQLALKAFIDSVRISAKNDSKIDVWNEHEEDRVRHSDHQAVEAGGCPATLAKLRDIVIKINASTSRRDKFHECQNTTRPLNVIQDVRTRWNSTLAMLRRSKRLQKALTTYSVRHHEDGIASLSEEEWRHVDYLIRLLGPFNMFTNMIGSQGNGPTVCHVFTTYNVLFSILDGHRDLLVKKTTPWKLQLLQAVEKASAKLSEYYSQTTSSLGDIYMIGTVLNPSYRFKYFEGVVWREQAYEDEHGETWAQTYRRRFETVYNQYATELEHKQASQSSGSKDHRATSTLRSEASRLSFQSTSPAPEIPSSSSLSSFIKLGHYPRGFQDLAMAAMGGTPDPVDSGDEITAYITDTRSFSTSYEGADHSLVYWKSMESQFPILAAMARDYLAIPAAGVDVERLFNIARDITTYRRHNLAGKTIRALVFKKTQAAFQMQEDLAKEKAARPGESDFDDCDELDDAIKQEVDRQQEEEDYISADDEREIEHSSSQSGARRAAKVGSGRRGQKIAQSVEHDEGEETIPENEGEATAQDQGPKAVDKTVLRQKVSSLPREQRGLVKGWSGVLKPHFKENMEKSSGSDDGNDEQELPPLTGLDKGKGVEKRGLSHAVARDKTMDLFNKIQGRKR